MLGSSQKRCTSLKKNEVRLSSVKKPSATMLPRKKESDIQVARSPSKKVLFSLENMKWQILQKFLTEVLGMEAGESRVKTELKIKKKLSG